MAIAAMSPKDAKLSVKSKATKSKVSFSDVQVRMYPVTLGTSPGGVAGPPLSLSWNYTSLGKATVEDFEKHRTDPQFRRRNYRELHISAKRRVSLLRTAGFSDRQIHQAAQEAAQERMERRKSLHQAILKCRALKREQEAVALTKARKCDIEETGQATLLKFKQEDDDESDES